MKKKTLILTQKQLDEICGGNSAYLDNFISKPNGENYFATEVSADGNVNGAFADNMTTDRYADDDTRENWPMGTKAYGKNGNYIPHNLTEMSKSEWEKKNLKKEEAEHGNKRLVARQFGPNGDNKSYDATKMAASRLNKAQKEVQTGATIADKQKAAQTIQRMKNNWGGIDNAMMQYGNAKAADKITQSAKAPGTKMESKPKTKVGTAHSQKNGIITPLE